MEHVNSVYFLDINECEEGVAICPENAECRNTQGSYRCECGRGFRHNAANNTCDGMIFFICSLFRSLVRTLVCSPFQGRATIYTHSHMRIHLKIKQI